MEIQKILSKPEWDEFVDEVKGNPLQLWAWGEVKRLHGWHVERVFVRDGGVVVGGAQILYRPLPFPFRSFAYVPRGPLVKDSRISLADLMDVLAAHVKKTRKSVVLTVEPEVMDVPLPQGWQQSENTVLSPETVYLDLSHSEEELKRDMNKSTRRAIKKSTEALNIRRATTREDLQICLDILHEASERAGFNLHSDKYYIDIFEQFGDNAAVFIAEYEGEPVAFDWLATSSGCTYDLYGSANTMGRKLRANYGITWHSIAYSQEKGIAYFDFGGMVEGGVSTFKNHWTKSPTVFVGTWDKPLSPLYVVWSKGLPTALKLLHKIRWGK
ncbi:MAG: peptidoglycan bridge formation glycyltransferase FemA/FemB family protein [Ancrocorticia sp.]